MLEGQAADASLSDMPGPSHLHDGSVSNIARLTGIKRKRIPAEQGLLQHQLESRVGRVAAGWRGARGCDEGQPLGALRRQTGGKPSEGGLSHWSLLQRTLHP